MAKKTKSKMTPHRKKFAQASKKCHKETDSPKAFGGCMSKALKKKGKKKSKKK